MSLTVPKRFPLLAAAFFGATGVGLGALGAHALQPLLDERGMSHTWETGARYHVYHAIALLALAGVMATWDQSRIRLLRWATWCWSVGIILFSGSLYWLALLGPRPRLIVFATPAGGLALLAGWICVLVAALRLRGSEGPTDQTVR